MWDRETGTPVYNVIVLQDRRTADHCARLKLEGHEERVRGKTGLLIDPYFSGTKVAWILDNVSGARARAQNGKLAFGAVDSGLIWNLTSGRSHVTDRINASRTLLYNIVEERWDAELLRLLNIRESMMPEVIRSNEKVSRASTSPGLGDIEIAGIAGDQQSARFGQLCVNAGDAENTFETGCFLLQNIGHRFTLSREHLITTMACSIECKPQYALEGSVFIGGAVVQWLRDRMRFFEKASDSENIAQSVADSCNLILVPAFTGSGAPHWDPYASGMLIGLQRNTKIGHIARAALESIAFQVADVLLALQNDTGTRSTRLRADDGAAANDMLMQRQANVLGISVERRAILETSAQGAGYLAGLATEYWTDVVELAKTRPAGQAFVPQHERDRATRQYARRQDAVTRSKGWNTGAA